MIVFRKVLFLFLVLGSSVFAMEPAAFNKCKARMSEAELLTYNNPDIEELVLKSSDGQEVSLPGELLFYCKILSEFYSEKFDIGCKTEYSFDCLMSIINMLKLFHSAETGKKYPFFMQNFRKYVYYLFEHRAHVIPEIMSAIEEFDIAEFENLLELLKGYEISHEPEEVEEESDKQRDTTFEDDIMLDLEEFNSLIGFLNDKKELYPVGAEKHIRLHPLDAQISQEPTYGSLSSIDVDFSQFMDFTE